MDKIRILIVDDHKVMRTMIRKMIDNEKFDIIEAENGKVAYDMLSKDETIKLLICDVNMPVMSGLQLLEEKKKLKAHATTDMVIITSAKSDELAEKALKNGAAAWITKPFKKAKLDEVLARFVP